MSYREYGIWYIVRGIWEFPKIRGPNIDPSVVALLLAGISINGPPIYRDSHF